MILITLFLEFFKIGLFAIGGGLATLPFLYELAGKYEWITVSDISSLVAISESTPGPLGINMATYVGFLRSGVLGSVTTTLGLVTPSVIVIILVSKFLSKFRENKIVQDSFYGLRAASCALIAGAGIGVSRLAFFGESIKDFFWQGALLGIVLFIATRKLKWHPVVFVFISAIVGIVFKFEM